MLVRTSRPASSMITAAALAVAFMVGLLIAPAGPASAADDPAKPWIVTRKADNRVLPKQDSVKDIEKGLADPGKASETKETAAPAPAPAPAAKPAPAAEAKPAAKPAAPAKPTPTPVAAGGQAFQPEITVSATEVVVMLPTSAVVTDTRYLNLDEPRRVALDVMGSWKYDGQKKMAVNKGVLEKVELGTHDDFLRLVLHLTKGKVPGEILPRFELVEGGLKMIVPLAP